MRARDCEAGVPLEYLKGLHAAYEVFIQDISRVIPVIKVDYSVFRTAEEMAQVVKKEYAKIANIRTVTFGSVITGGYVSPIASPEKKKQKTADEEQAESAVQIAAASAVAGC